MKLSLLKIVLSSLIISTTTVAFAEKKFNEPIVTGRYKDLDNGIIQDRQKLTEKEQMANRKVYYTCAQYYGTFNYTLISISYYSTICEDDKVSEPCTGVEIKSICDRDIRAD